VIGPQELATKTQKLATKTHKTVRDQQMTQDRVMLGASLSEVPDFLAVVP
jgi:hypothetical protein